MIQAETISVGVGYPNAWSSLLGGLATRVCNTLLSWQDRADQRASLASLDDHMLEDIGLTRADVYREYRKPLWVV